MKKYQKSIFISIILIIFSISIGIIPPSVNACGKPSYFKEHALWKESNGQNYLDIKANDYYTLGHFEGIELASKIRGLKTSIETLFANYGIPYNYLLELANSYKPFIPGDYISEMQGMADALKFQNITFGDVLLQNCFMDIYYGIFIPQMSGIPIPPIEIGCTAIAALNKGGSVSIGQNFDFSQFLHPTLSFVLHQIKGKQSIFSIRMGGMLALPMGKNSKGVISTVNIVETIVMGTIGIPATFRSRLGFENSKYAEEYFQYIKGDNFPVSFNSIYTDKNSIIIGTENVPNIYVKEIVHGLDYVIRTNTFISDELKPFLKDPYYSVNRQNKAEELVENSFKDKKLSLHEFMTILQYKDGTDASICRIESSEPLACQTGAFMACKQKNYHKFGIFGLGNAIENSWGIIPI